MAKAKQAKKMLVVHTHERSEGSTILAVFPATAAGRRAAERMRAGNERSDVDVASVDEVEVGRVGRG